VSARGLRIDRRTFHPERISNTRREYWWSGQVIEPVDYMGFMGKNPGDDNVFIITGDSEME
jgi:hypothetical protein